MPLSDLVTMTPGPAGQSGADSGQSAPPAPSTIADLRKDTADLATRAALEHMTAIARDLRDPAVTRPQLRQRLMFVALAFPLTFYAPRAGEFAAQLETMIAEDAAHTPVSDEQLAALPAPERVRELLYRLRDETGEPFPNVPGQPSVAEQLLALGPEAREQLVAAYGNTTPLRYANHPPSELLTVSGVAAMILARHDALHLYFPTFDLVVPETAPTSGTPFRAGSYPTVSVITGLRETPRQLHQNSLAELQAWWQEMQTSGEHAMLRARTLAGSGEHAKLLTQRYRADAEPVLITALEKAPKTGFTTLTLIELLADYQTPDSRSALQRELETTTNEDDFAAAARALHRHGDPRAVELALERWSAQPKQTHLPHNAIERFLLLSDDPAGVLAVIRTVPQRPHQSQYDILNTLRERPRNQPSIPAATALALEEGLIQTLLELEKQDGLEGRITGTAFQQHLVRARLVNALRSLRPDRYAFSVSSGAIMPPQAARVGLINTWRTANQLPPVPLPEPVRPLGLQEPASTVVRVRWAADSAEAGASLRQDVDGWLGQPLRTKAVMDLINGFVATPPPDVAGLQLRLQRETAGQGIEVTVRLAPANRPVDRTRIRVGGSLAGTSGPKDLEFPQREWYGRQGAAEDAIEQAANSPYRLAFHLTLSALDEKAVEP